MDFTLGMLGFAGALICAVGDILLDFKGSDNKKIGYKMTIDSNWEKMSEWRFHVSIILAAIGVPLYFMGFVAMRNQLSAVNELLATAFIICAVIGTCGGFFIHATLCYNPIIYKTLKSKNIEFDIINEVIKKIFKAGIIPLIVMFSCLVFATSGIVIYAIISNILTLPKIFIIFTPISLMIIGMLFRLIDKKIFADLLGICMPTIGLGMIGLMAAINSLSPVN